MSEAIKTAFAQSVFWRKAVTFYSLRLLWRSGIAAFFIFLVATNSFGSPNIIFSVDKTSNMVGGQMTYMVTGAQPNSPVYWSSWKDGVSTGEVNATYGHSTDANGCLTVQTSAWLSSHVGKWVKQVTIGSKSAKVAFEVAPAVSVNKQVYDVAGEQIIYTITGAPPNSPIYFSQWKDGVAISTNVQQSTTDASGNKTISMSAQPTERGFWQTSIAIGSINAPKAPVCFTNATVVTGTLNIKVDKASFKVGEPLICTITGAAANKPIYWSSVQEDWVSHNLISTGETNQFYGHYTDASGNFTVTTGAWIPAWVGIWKKTVTINGVSCSVSFQVKPGDSNTFAKRVGSKFWTAGGAGYPEIASGIKKIGDMGGRSVNVLFSTSTCPNLTICPNPLTAACNPLIQLAETTDFKKIFNDPRINTYVLTIFGGYSECKAKSVNGKLFFDESLFNPSLYPGFNYSDAIRDDLKGLTLYLYQTYANTGKRFILTDSESDNAVHGGNAYLYSLNGRFPPYVKCNNGTLALDTDAPGRFPCPGNDFGQPTKKCSNGNVIGVNETCPSGTYETKICNNFAEVAATASCPDGSAGVVSPWIYVNGGRQIPDVYDFDPNHRTKWTLPWRSYVDTIIYPVAWRIKKYDGSQATSNDAYLGYKRWWQARQNGVSLGRDEAITQGYKGVEVYHSPEFSLFTLLKTPITYSPIVLTDMVHDAIPQIDFDFVNYSAYETISFRGNEATSRPTEPWQFDSFVRRIGTELDQIQAVVAPSYAAYGGKYRNLLISEFGYFNNQDGVYPPVEKSASEIEKTYQRTFDAMLNFGSPHAFVWHAYPGEEGQAPVFTSPTDLTLKPLGSYFNARFNFPFSTTPVNFALNQLATQSSTGYSALASRAVDGNTNGNFNNNSVTHTNTENTPWWQVDLGNVKNIDTIKIWNRTDCCTDRLSDFNVFISDVDFGTISSTNDPIVITQHPNVWATYISGQAYTSGSPTAPTTINVQRSGRYVRIQLRNSATNPSRPLSLAEVQVFGKP